MNKKGTGTKLISRNFFLLLINDNVNTFCDVVFAINDCTSLDLETAYNVCLTAHVHGNSIVLSGSLKELCRVQKQLKANKLTTRLAVIHGGFNWN